MSFASSHVVYRDVGGPVRRILRQTGYGVAVALIAFPGLATAEKLSLGAGVGAGVGKLGAGAGVSVDLGLGSGGLDADVDVDADVGGSGVGAGVSVSVGSGSGSGGGGGGNGGGGNGGGGNGGGGGGGDGGGGNGGGGGGNGGGGGGNGGGGGGGMADDGGSDSMVDPTKLAGSRCAKDGNTDVFNGYQVLDRDGRLVGMIHDAVITADQTIAQVRMMTVKRTCVSLTGGSYKVKGGTIRVNIDGALFR